LEDLLPYKIQDPTLHGAGVTPTSLVHMAAMLLLLTGS